MTDPHRNKTKRDPGKDGSAFPAALSALRQRLEHVGTRDRRVLLRDVERLASQSTLGADGLSALDARIGQAQARRTARAASVPQVAVDQSLPIATEAERIVELIRAHPVVIVAGETGSGKTTQLPKLCLAAGRGVDGLIGCTQPRRIAARSVARRVAQELGTELGALVGYQVRFTEQVGPQSLIKFMTDGILLAETQGDAWLNAYDTLIIDEAHERSLNIDFLLGYLKRLLLKRRDLKVIVTSATIDTERFSAHFGGAPIVNVEGRGYPVEVRYFDEERAGLLDAARDRSRGPGERARDKDDFDPLSLLAIAADDITREDPRGDVLVFLPGEREIRDAHQALERRKYRDTEVLPLYARLSSRDQDRVFNPGPKRRIVLTTNVAETSLTVPRIRYVIDPGVARINRFSHRHKVQRLHIEPISQASADQRKGRCGRVGPGICYRLYSEQDFAARPRYTDPELLRSSLAGVILRLLSLRLGAIEEFPFLDPPAERAIADGYQQLQELGALHEDRRSLTGIGHTLAKLPIDVKLGRMLVEAQRLGALRELTVLAAFLSIPDPRERPAEARAAADRAHAELADPKSDFVGVLKLWDAYRIQHEELTQSKLRDWCERQFLSFMRMREWRELHRQLLVLCQELAWSLNADAASYEAVHRTLLSGLVGQVARKDEKGVYQGTRGRKYTIFPGSSVSKAPPLWLLSATLLDTQRLYGLMNARVEPEWIEQQAAHLVKRRHFDPHWVRTQGRVVAYEQVTLFGLALVEKRRVNFGSLDPVAAREVFVREALVRGDIDCRAAFVKRNADVLVQAHEEEAKRRRRGLLKSEEDLHAWLEPRIGPGLSTSAGLDAWYKALDPELKRGLEWSLADVIAADATPENEFPAALFLGTHKLAIEYRFEPMHVADGATLLVPLGLLNAVSGARLSWLVPGLLRDKVAELLRGLPKTLRRNFVPVPDFAQAFVEAVRMEERPLPRVLSEWLHKTTGVAVPEEQLDESGVPAHLRFNLRLLDADGGVLIESRDLEALRVEYGPRAQQQFARHTAAAIAREGLTRFDFDELPESVRTDAGLAAYPALVATDTGVAIRVFEQAQAAAQAHPRGVMALLRLALADKLRSARKQMPLAAKAAIAYTAIGSPDELRADIVEASLIDVAAERVALVRGRAAFEQLVLDLSKRLFVATTERLQRAEDILLAYAELAPKLKPAVMGLGKANFDDLRQQLAGLVYAGFARDVSVARLQEIPRYLRAMAIRVERLQLDPRKDQQRMMDVLPFVEAHRDLSARAIAGREGELDRLRWLIEEYRVQLFAQELKTREPVSDKRLRKLVEDLNRK